MRAATTQVTTHVAPDAFDVSDTVPEGVRGDYRIERFTVDQHDAELDALRSMFNGGRSVQPGTYTRLMRGDTVVMSDTDSERRDHAEPVRRARRSVLVHGLGIGMVARAMLLKPEVDHVLVIEKSRDVIDLVAPALRERFGGRVQVNEGDALTWAPSKDARWSVVWHDIWDNICPDNLPDMRRLHRRFARRADWQGSWARWRCEQQALRWRSR